VTENRQYGIRRVVALPYEEAVEKTKEALKQQGFGVLSEIDMKAKLKEKLGVDYKRYVILGACNPPLAYKALQADPEIGLLLPCRGSRRRQAKTRESGRCDPLRRGRFVNGRVSCGMQPGRLVETEWG